MHEQITQLSCLESADAKVSLLLRPSRFYGADVQNLVIQYLQDSGYMDRKYLREAVTNLLGKPLILRQLTPVTRLEGDR